MSSLPANPYTDGLQTFASQIREGSQSFSQAMAQSLARIDALNGRLNAFEYVNAEQALVAAKSMDDLLATGTDLGPLMGVAVAIKDIITVDGMPVTNGSNADTAHINGPEGHVVRTLREAGCIVIGKTKTVEFALGATGANDSRGVPWNPWDSDAHRIPGGSSSGSAVAVAAGLCGFALGSDTGGSIRIPACYNGLFGHKTTVGLWPTNGVFPLSPTLDSIGPLCKYADDAAVVHQAMTDETVGIATINGRRFGRPTNYFLDDLDPEVASAFDTACEKLRDAGADIVDITIPEVVEREVLFPAVVAPELVATLTPDFFKQISPGLDSVTRTRAEHAFQVSAIEHASALQRRKVLEQMMIPRMAEFDGWISPTCPALPIPVPALKEKEAGTRALQSSRNTQPANLFGQCASSLPIGQLTNTVLPVGLQLMCGPQQDAKLLALSAAIESVLGTGDAPNLTTFL